MREIITLQLGPFANFVGSHFWNIQDEFSSQNGKGTVVRDNALYQEREFRGKSIYTPRSLILDVEGNLGSMSKEGNYLYPSASDLEALSEYASSSWGGSVSVSRFESIPKVPFQRTLEENVGLFSSSGRSASSSSDPITELIRTKQALIQSKHVQLDAMKSELTANAKSGKSQNSHLFELQRRISELESEIKDLQDDIERRKRLQAINNGEEGDKAALFDLTHSKYWTDFNKTFWHPTSLNIISSLSDTSPVDVYSAEVMSPDELELFMDRLRLSFENCDQVEGLQLMVDADTTFGAISASILNEMKDDVGKVRIVSFPLFAPGGNSIGQLPADIDRIRSINRGLTLSSLHGLSSLVMPLDSTFWRESSFSSINQLQTSNLYHLSAIIASTIDSITLPTRSIEDGLEWRQFIENIACVSPSVNFGLVSTSFPLPLSQNNTLSRHFFGYDIFANPETMTDEERTSAATKRILPHASWMTPMIPFSKSGKGNKNIMDDTSSGVSLPWGESVVLRGVQREFAKNPASSDNYAPQILFNYLKRYSARSRYFAAWEPAAALPISYPRFFDPNLRLTDRVPILTHVQNSRRIGDYIHSTTKGLTTEDARRYPTLNYDPEQVLAARDDLLTLEEDYAT